MLCADHFLDVCKQLKSNYRLSGWGCTGGGLDLLIKPNNRRLGHCEAALLHLQWILVYSEHSWDGVNPLQRHFKVEKPPSQRPYSVLFDHSWDFPVLQAFFPPPFHIIRVPPLFNYRRLLALRYNAFRSEGDNACSTQDETHCTRQGCPISWRTWWWDSCWLLLRDVNQWANRSP